jgi:hypothetical protein
VRPAAQRQSTLAEKIAFSQELKRRALRCSVSDLTVGLSVPNLKQFIRTECDGGEELAMDRMKKKQLLEILAVLSKQNILTTTDPRPDMESYGMHKLWTKHLFAANQLQAILTRIQEGLHGDRGLGDLLTEHPHLLRVLRSLVLKIVRDYRGQLSDDERDAETREILADIERGGFYESKGDLLAHEARRGGVASQKADRRFGMVLRLLRGMEVAESCKRGCLGKIKPATFEQVQTAASQARTMIPLQTLSDEAFTNIMLLLIPAASIADVCACSKRQGRRSHLPSEGR